MSYFWQQKTARASPLTVWGGERIEKPIDDHFYELEKSFIEKGDKVTPRELRKFHKEFVKYGKEHGFPFMCRYPNFPIAFSCLSSLVTFILAILVYTCCQWNYRNDNSGNRQNGVDNNRNPKTEFLVFPFWKECFSLFWKRNRSDFPICISIRSSFWI